MCLLYEYPNIFFVLCTQFHFILKVTNFHQMEYVNFSCQNPNLKVHNPTDIIRGHAEALIDETSR